MKPLRLPYFTCEFTLSGLNLERFMNIMQKENMPLLAARRMDQRTLRCECYTADLPAVRTLAEEKGWRIQAESPRGFSAVFARLKARPGLWVGALLAAAVMIGASQFVWRVDIYGAGAYRADIAAFLKAEGLGVGSLKTQVDAARLEEQLLRRYPELAWFQVYVYHVTMVVDCTQGVPMPALPGGEPGDITAARDGVIAEIHVFAGTPAVRAGDVVHKGDVLIRGQERGENGQWSPVQARGEVIARCWRTARVSLPLREVISRETGAAATGSQLCTPWFAWPAEAEAPDYLAYNTYLTVRPVVGAFFPCFQKAWEWREVAMEYAPRDPGAVEQEAAQAAYKKLEKALKGYEIIDKWVDYCMIEDDTLAASATAEWLMDIGETAP